MVKEKILIRKGSRLASVCQVTKKDNRFYRFKQINCKPIEVLENGVRVIDEHNNISHGDKLKFGNENIILVET